MMLETTTQRSTPMSLEILHELTDVLTLPVGPHNTCAASGQRNLPVPNPEAKTKTAI